MADSVGADPLGPLMRVRADQVLAAVRCDDVTWEDLQIKCGLSGATLNSVIPWMCDHGELQVVHTYDAKGKTIVGAYRQPDDRRLAYALEMVQQTFECTHQSTRAISRGRMILMCNVCMAERDRLGVWHRYGA